MKPDIVIPQSLEYPDISLYQMLKQNSRERGNLTAYNYFGRKQTYGGLLKEIEQCAEAFWAVGVRPKDRVTICMPNTPQAIAAFYGLNQIGAVSNMIHPLSAENEIRHYLNVSDSKVLVTVDLSWPRIQNIIGQTKVCKVIVVSVKESMPLFLKIGYQLAQGRKLCVPPESEQIMYWKHFIKHSEKGRDKKEAEAGGKEEAVILYSGGTSGYPKGIRLSNLNFNALAMQSIAACACLSEGDRVLSIMPIFHGFGLGICIHTVLNFGGTAIILPQFHAKTFHKLLKKYKPNVIAGVPTLYEALLNHKKAGKLDLSFLKCVISGGDSLSVSLKEKLDAFLQSRGAGVQVREGYGLTECVTGSCLTPPGYYKRGSIGLPYPDTEYKIVKPETQEELPNGEVGEIVLCGPSVMLGYLNDKEETDKTLRIHNDGKRWLHTGDLGCMDEEGFVYFKQRMNRMIVSSGYNIYPQHIENVINSHPAVRMCCVVAKEHPYKHQVAKAYVVPADNTVPEECLKKELFAHCQKELAKYSLPEEIQLCNSLPQTLVGKVAYTKLMEEENGK